MTDKKLPTPIRVRIAPSPTGNLHIGTARAALYNELFARQQDGIFIVRIEDTDAARSKPEYEKNILEGLAWLGLQWQEGPDVGGSYGPYRQSERIESYTNALRTLLDLDKAYFCTCDQNINPKPECTCSIESAGKEIDLESMPIKLKVTPQTISFTDLVRGEVSVHTDSFGGDFVIARTIKNPVFHLAVVVDDEEMAISHVIRGEDHISNTAKHILIQQALGFKQPIYSHLPLLLDEKRRKLSKRNGETSLLAYRDMGFLPQAVLNYLALLGWNPGDEREFLSHEDLIKEFSFNRVQKGGAIFSMTKLMAVNKYYIRLLSTDELFELAKPFLEKDTILMENVGLLKMALLTEQPRLQTLAEIPGIIGFYLPNWPADYDKNLLVWKKSDIDKTKNILSQLIKKVSEIDEIDFLADRLQKLFIEWIDATGTGRGDTLWPMRVALSGKEYSPAPFEIAAVIGKQQTLKRLEIAQKKLS